MRVLKRIGIWASLAVVGFLVLMGMLMCGRESEPPRGLRNLVPRPPRLAEQMIVSWYGDPFHGRRTASGRVFNKHDFTAAHRELKFGTRLKLRYQDREVVVTITDRGPYRVWKGVRYFNGERDLDVSEAVATALGFKQRGLAVVDVWILGAEDGSSDD